MEKNNSDPWMRGSSVRCFGDGEVRLVVRGCVVTVRYVRAICVNGTDTLVLNTFVICGEYS